MLKTSSLLALLATVGLYAAADTITIDAASDRGPAKCITGFLHGYEKVEDADLDQLRALKPRHFRVGTDTMMIIAEKMNAENTVVISDYYVRDDQGYHYPDAKPWEDWEHYEEFLRDLVKRVSENYKYPQVYWDVWNEPDSSYFFPGTQEQFIELAARTYRTIKSIHPDYLVIGPCWSPYRRDMAKMLAELDQQYGVRFDCVAWHENGPAEPHEFPAHVKEFREDIAKLIGPDYNPPIQINEYGSSAMHLNPGYNVAWLQVFEQEGIEVTARACWPIYTGTPDDHELHGDCWLGLNGLLMPTDNKTTQHIYWVYKAYADQTGRRLKVTSDKERVRAIASRDDGEKTVHVLVGRYATSRDVNIVIQNFPYDAPDGVTVIVDRIPNETELIEEQILFTKAKPLLAPIRKRLESLALKEGTLQFSIDDFHDGDAYIVRCVPTDSLPEAEILY